MGKAKKIFEFGNLGIREFKEFRIPESGIKKFEIELKIWQFGNS